MFKKFFKKLKGPTEQEKFLEYMNQATSREHVEWLERQWFNQNRHR